LLTEPWPTLVGICVIYLLQIPVGIAAYAKVRRQRALRDMVSGDSPGG
jgi:CDP-diacylglycerol---serine O-phosphatidyltransferase